MRKLLITFLALPFIAFSSQVQLLALDINCNSPVWKNRKPCIGKKKKENLPMEVGSHLDLIRETSKLGSAFKL